MVFLCLEGPPGSGKEAVARQLAVTYSIPVCIHKATSSDLADAQQDETRWSFYTQLRIFADRVAKLRDLSTLTTVVVNGSPVSDRVCHAAASKMDKAERDLYDKWTDVLSGTVRSSSVHILLNLDLEATFHAVVHEAKREQGHWTMARLQNLHGLYNRSFGSGAVAQVARDYVDNEVMLQTVAQHIFKHHVVRSSSSIEAGRSGAKETAIGTHKNLDIRCSSGMAGCHPLPADTVDAGAEPDNVRERKDLSFSSSERTDRLVGVRA